MCRYVCSLPSFASQIRFGLQNLLHMLSQQMLRTAQKVFELQMIFISAYLSEEWLAFEGL